MAQLALALLLFVALPLIELTLIVKTGQMIGALPTISLLLAAGVGGATLLISQGRGVWKEINDALGDGRVPRQEAIDGALIVAGGTMLIAPGFITDLLGLSMLVPPSRKVIHRGLRHATIEPIRSRMHPAVTQLEKLFRDPDAEVAPTARIAAAELQSDPPPLFFDVLGGFRVSRGTRTIEPSEWRRPMVTRVLSFLLVHLRHTIPEDSLFDAFWPDRDPSAARRSLQVTISYARSALGIPGGGEKTLVVNNRNYELRLRERDRADFLEFEAAATAALEDTGAFRVQLLERAEALWGGEPLPEARYEPWAADFRERLIGRFTEVLTALATARQRAGDAPGAIGPCRQLVELDGLNEAHQQQLMVAYARAGRRGDALGQYLECRRQLQDGLGVEPSVETAALHDAILAGRDV